MMQGAFRLIRNEEQRRLAREELERTEIGDKGFYLQIKPGVPPRTELQHRYLFGWVYEQLAQLLNDAGIHIPMEGGAEYPYDKEILHEIFKKKFLIVSEVTARNGSTITVCKSTTKLNKQEFSDYVESIHRFSFQFWRVQIPQPTRGVWFDYYKELGLA